MRVLPLILARGGSKRLPNKNLLALGNKTLVEIAVEQALDVFGEAFVSTDSLDIVKVVTGTYGKQVSIFNRPAALASDLSPSALSIIHAAIRARLGDKDMICLLQPTSPLRSAEDIVACVATSYSDEPAFTHTRLDSSPNGAVYSAATWCWRNWPDNRDAWRRVEMPPERSLDIDTDEDYKRAVALWQK